MNGLFHEIRLDHFKCSCYSAVYFVQESPTVASRNRGTHHQSDGMAFVMELYVIAQDSRKDSSGGKF